MSTPEYRQDSLDLLDSIYMLQEATSIMREHQEKLRALTERAKALFKECIDEQQEVQSSLQMVESKLNAGQSIETMGGEEVNPLDLVLLKEEEQLLTQQSFGLSERLASLQQTLQSLRRLARHAEIASQFTLSEFDPLREDDGQLTRIAQMRALQTQEMERQRLAREVHDGPAQVLANAIFELEYCELLLSKDPEGLADELAKLKRDVREGLGEVRNFIFDLRPAPRAEIGLRAMLREYADNYQSRFAIRVVAELDDVGRHPAGQETAIYRIVQEALQNVKKHSHATEVKMKLRCHANSLQVSVEDNGIGFDVTEQLSEQVEHFGLTSMRERSQLIGGELEIDSAPGKGTRVELTVPLNSYSEEA